LYGIKKNLDSIRKWLIYANYELCLHPQFHEFLALQQNVDGILNDFFGQKNVELEVVYLSSIVKDKLPSIVIFVL
jgi:hypothetical protein